MKFTLNGLGVECQTVEAAPGFDGPALLDVWSKDMAFDGTNTVWAVCQRGVEMFLDLTGAADAGNWKDGVFGKPALRVSSEGGTPEEAAKAFAGLFLALERDRATATYVLDVRLNERYARAGGYGQGRDVRKVKAEITCGVAADAPPGPAAGGLTRHIAREMRLTPVGAPLNVTVHVPVELGMKAENWQEVMP